MNAGAGGPGFGGRLSGHRPQGGRQNGGSTAQPVRVAPSTARRPVGHPTAPAGGKTGDPAHWRSAGPRVLPANGPGNMPRHGLTKKAKGKKLS